MLMSAELKGCVTWFIYFLDLLWVRYNCAKFHHCRICVTDFRARGSFCSPPIREQHRKIPSWIGFRRNPANICLFKATNWNTRKTCKICSKLTIKTPERRQRHCEHLSHIFLMFLLLTLNNWLLAEKILIQSDVAFWWDFTML